MAGRNIWSQTYKGCGCNVNIDLTNDQIMQALYEAWLDQGNTGTEQDFLDSLTATCDNCGGFTPPACSNGQIMKFNATSGTWECADEAVGSDTLATLNCADGQVPKWNGTAWVCASDEVGVGGTDTLASLSCGVGQVPKWNGTAWACADDTDTDTTIPDTTIPNTDTLADLNCSEGQIPKFIGGTWVCSSDQIGTGGTSDTNTTISYGAFRVICYTDGTGQSTGTCVEEITTNTVTNTSTTQQLYFDKDGNTLNPNLIVACVTNSNDPLPNIEGLFGGYICYEDTDGKVYKGEISVTVNPNTGVKTSVNLDKDGNVLTTYVPGDCCLVCEDGGVIVDPVRTCAWTEEGEECFQTSTTTGGNTSYTIPDAYTAQSFSDLQNAINWGNGVDLLIGEHGTPNDRPADQALHNTRTEAELAFLACKGVGWTGWSTGQNWGSDFLQIYDDNGNPTPGAPGYQNSFGNTVITGVNYAHFDFDNGTGWPPGLIGPQTLSNFQAIAADGATHLRLPTLWKYSLADQNNIYSDIAQSFKDAYCLTLDYAQQAGLKVIVDIHEYGQFNHKIDPNNCQQTIGTTGSLHDAYLAHVDNLLEVQCNTATHNGPLYQHPAFAGLDIMNEPRCITWQNWESISQDVYNQVRANQGNGVTLFIPTAGGYSGAQDASPNGANVHQQGPWITGAVNVIYEFHYYSHKNHSGIPGQWQSYAQENQDAINAGYGVGGNQTYNEGDVITNCPLLAGETTTLGPCETYTKEVERYTDAPFEICGGTRYKDQNGTVTDVSGLQSCTCPTDNGGGNTGGTTYVSCERPANYPVCPANLAGWHRVVGTDPSGDTCVVGWNGTGECWFDPANGVPQQED